jgi:hypothetical protein
LATVTIFQLGGLLEVEVVTMQTKTEEAATTQNGESVETDAAPAQPVSRTTPDGSAVGTDPGAECTEATTTISQSTAVNAESTSVSLTASGVGTTTALAIWDNVPNTQAPDLTVLSSLSFNDLLSAAKKMWKFGRMTHDIVVAIFRQIIVRYDGRQATRPPMKVEEAFASIGVNYEAARKMVYRDRKKRELEAIAASLHLPTASTPTTSIFHVDDEVTIADGDGVIERVHQTTGRIDIVLDETQEPVANIDPKHVMKLNGVPVIDGKLAKQKEHVLVAGELLIDSDSGKKWIFADGKFSMTKMLTRSEVKEEAVARLKAESDAARKRKEEEKRVRQAQAASKEKAKVNAAKAKREAAQAKREAKRAGAADKAAKAAAKAKKRPATTRTAIPVKVKTFVTKRFDNPVDDYVFGTFNADDLNTPLSKSKKLHEAEAETARLNAKYGTKGVTPEMPLAGAMPRVRAPRLEQTGA